MVPDCFTMLYYASTDTADHRGGGVLPRQSKSAAKPKQKSAALALRPPGRAAGTPNKVSAQAKDNILEVFVKLGGVAEMAKWAKDNKTIFYSRIYARLLPKDVTLGADAGLEDLLGQLAEKRSNGEPMLVDGDYTEVSPDNA